MSGKELGKFEAVWLPLKRCKKDRRNCNCSGSLWVASERWGIAPIGGGAVDLDPDRNCSNTRATVKGFRWRGAEFAPEVLTK